MDNTIYDKKYFYVVVILVFIVVASSSIYFYKNKKSISFDTKTDSQAQMHQEDLIRMNAELDKVREAYADIEKSKPTVKEQTKSMDSLRKLSLKQQKIASTTTAGTQSKELDAVAKSITSPN